MRAVIVLILFVITVILGVTFTCLNPESVTVNFYLGEYILPLPVLLLITLGIGMGIGIITIGLLFVKQKAENYRLRYRVRMVEQEVENLRAIPLKDTH